MPTVLILDKNDPGIGEIIDGLQAKAPTQFRNIVAIPESLDGDEIVLHVSDITVDQEETNDRAIRRTLQQTEEQAENPSGFDQGDL
jgi:hypothetical protein